MNGNSYCNEMIAQLEDKVYAAFDLGTSHIVCAILDGVTEKEIMRVVDYNPQYIYGKDMEQRIRYGAENQDRVTAMREVTLHTMNRMLLQATDNLGLTPNKVARIVVAANNANAAILRGKTWSIVEDQFVQYYKRMEEVRADEAGFRVYDYGMLYMLPQLGGVLGGDLLASVLATKLAEQEELSLMIDIGTGVQFALGNKEKIFCMSGSEVGTGFDGVGTEHNLYGSELLEVLADYQEEGKVDRNGKILIPGGPLNQNDVNRIHHGKTVTMSALKYFLDACGYKPQDIQKVYLCGSFDVDMDTEVLYQLGVLPVQFRGKVSIVGNTVLEGSKKCACSYEAFEKTEKIARKVKYISGFSQKDIVEEFWKFEEYRF